MRTLALALLCLLLLPAASACGEARFTDCLIQELLAPSPPAAARGARADTTWLFAPSGFGAYGEAGTTARGYSFDGTGECFEAAWTGEGGSFAQVRSNPYAGDVNPSCLWTFFDADTTEPGYPMGVFPYGPPYFQMFAQSPPLERGDDGELLALPSGEGQLVLSFDVYLDLPLNAVVFQYVEVSGRTASGEYWVYDNPTGVLHYGQSGWTRRTVDITEKVYDLIGGPDSTLAGVRVRLGFVDMCADWCGVFGSGYPHTVAGFFDNVAVGLVREGTAAPALPAAPMALAAPYPNPFNPSLRIPFSLAEPGAARLSIVDLCGRQVDLLHEGPLAAGEHVLEWKGRDAAGRPLSSGVYFVRLETATGNYSQKAVLLR